MPTLMVFAPGSRIRMTGTGQLAAVQVAYVGPSGRRFYQLDRPVAARPGWTPTTLAFHDEIVLEDQMAA